MEYFDRWVSLGSFCLPKFQINRRIAVKYFGQPNDTATAHEFIQTADRDKLRQINGGTSFFDWRSVYDDREKMMRHIRDDFRDFHFGEGTLTELKNENGDVVNILDTSLGVTYRHLFSQNENGHHLDWRAEVDLLRPKVTHMINTFRDLKHEKTLYIMTTSEGGAHSDLGDRKMDALRIQRGAEAKHHHLLICVEGTTRPPDREGITYRNYPVAYDYAEYPWLGHAGSWDAMFQGFEHGVPTRPQWQDND